MPAAQQSSIPVYQDTNAIPRPNTAYYQFSKSDSPGAALAEMLGVSAKPLQKMKDQADAPPSKMEEEQLAALAVMGAEKDRLKLAGGTGMFGILKDPDASMDSYEINRGRRDADLYAGKLRTEYAESGLAENDDPKAFAAFVQQRQNDIFGTTLKDADASYYHGFVTRVSSAFFDMTKAHTGNLDTFITSRSKQAMQTRLEQKAAIDLAAMKETTAFGSFMDTIMGAESGGNYNAFHGNTGNSSLRFTDMSIQDVLDWQKSGDWKRLGAGSSAVGKYQFIESTLRQVVRASGIDPNSKFTPAVQDKLIMFRLFNDRSMQDYLDGKISDEEMVDKNLAAEFAGLKTTSGKGFYDGDGLNKASFSARKTIAALQQFKAAYMRDPAKVVAKDDSGKLIIGGPAPSEMGAEVESAEREYGLPQTEVRAAAADALVKMIQADPTLADRDDLEDIMASSKLSMPERQRVTEVRDRVRSDSAASATIAAQEKDAALLRSTDAFLRKGDRAALDQIRTSSPDVHSKLLALEASPGDPREQRETSAAFIEHVSYDDLETPMKAMRAYADGMIDKPTYSRVMGQFETVQNAKEVLELPGVDAFVSSLESALPKDAQRQFRSGLATVAADLRQQNDGKRPSAIAIMEEAQKLHGVIAAGVQQDHTARMSRYQ